ncbi:MAG: hypothetical protein EA402_13930 [Planctomycetota bacterium]|nr:MAG: hypothetical protein EA402_13930 [Planctomycetota bacterium]
MQPTNGETEGLAGATHRMAKHLLVIGENRLELLHVELQEGRDELVHLIGLGAALGVLVLLALMAFTAGLIIALWVLSPVLVLSILGLIYTLLAYLTWRSLRGRWQSWKLFEASFEQLHRDYAAFDRDTP